MVDLSRLFQSYFLGEPLEGMRGILCLERCGWRPEM